MEVVTKLSLKHKIGSTDVKKHVKAEYLDRSIQRIRHKKIELDEIYIIIH